MAPAVPGSPCVRVLYSYKILGWVGMLSEAGRFRSLMSFPCLFLEGFFFLFMATRLTNSVGRQQMFAGMDSSPSQNPGFPLE